jgi:aminoglycoside 6-adenylyltransferase
VTVEQFLAAATEWAALQPDVHGLVLVGSQARSEIPADEYFARGYRILYDGLGLEELLGALSPTGAEARDLAEIAQDFWFHALWAAKKWRRGEAVVARSCLEAHLKPLLLEADRLRASGDTWHLSRFAESWAAPEVLDAWWTATARAPEELPGALVRLCDVFAGLSPHDTARTQLEELLA